VQDNGLQALDAEPPRFRVKAADRAPLIEFMVQALRSSGCAIIYQSPPEFAPFRITFEAPNGERMGVVAYAFLANSTPTRNRPPDEHRFQVKYGSRGGGELHTLWQDPHGLYTTLFLGINPKDGFFVAADPVLHSPTRFFISIEFKEEHKNVILRSGWHAWERERRQTKGHDEPIEVLVGGSARSFLRYIYFEREALREDQGHRHLLAEKLLPAPPTRSADVDAPPSLLSVNRLHALAREFELAEHEVFDLIARAPRLKMAVRGWVAEEHLVRMLRGTPGVDDCQHLGAEGGPDVSLRYRGGRVIRVECKNVLRARGRGPVRMDLQRTRASKSDPCSRYYSPEDFDVVAACLHAVSERWDFKLVRAAQLDLLQHKCPGKLSNLVKLDERWSRDIDAVLGEF